GRARKRGDGDGLDPCSVSVTASSSFDPNSGPEEGIESGIGKMKLVGLLGIAKQTCALVSLATLLACGVTADEDTTHERAKGDPKETTGAEVPIGGASDSEVNPQRSPEEWGKPDSAPESPERE